MRRATGILMALVCQSEPQPCVGHRFGERSGRLPATPSVPRGRAGCGPESSTGGAHEGRCRREAAPGERRVALVPEALGKLTSCRLEILVEAGAVPVPRSPTSSSSRPGQGRPHGRAVCPVRRHPARPEADRIRGEDPAQGPGPRRPAAAAARSRADADARGRRRHRDQPGRHPSHAEPGPDDGRPELAGERRRLQGGPACGERLRPLLPAPHHGGGHGQAGQRADPRHRRGGPAGDRHGPAARCGGGGVRRPAGDRGAGREPRCQVRQAQDHDRRDRRGRVRPRADAPRSAPPSRRSSTRPSAGWTS